MRNLAGDSLTLLCQAPTAACLADNPPGSVNAHPLAHPSVSISCNAYRELSLSSMLSLTRCLWRKVHGIEKKRKNKTARKILVSILAASLQPITV